MGVVFKTRERARYSFDRAYERAASASHTASHASGHNLVPHYQGEVTHIGAVQIAATGVKTWSNGQATLRGAVKRSSGCFPLYTAL